MMSNIFDKVNDNLYLIKDPSYFIKKATDIYNSICDSTQNEYEEHTSRELFNSIVSRLVSVEFFKAGLTFPNTNFVQVILSTPNGEIACTIGIIKINEKIKRVSGVLYK